MTDNIEVYGPNGDEVEGFISRTDYLTENEITQFERAWWDKNDDTYNAWSNARDAASDAGYDHFWSNAHTHVSISSEEAYSVVTDALAALVVKDLIGKSGFSQKNFDTLYGPWREVIERTSNKKTN